MKVTFYFVNLEILKKKRITKLPALYIREVGQNFVNLNEAFLSVSLSVRLSFCLFLFLPLT